MCRWEEIGSFNSFGRSSRFCSYWCDCSPRSYSPPFARWCSWCEHRRALEQETERTGTHKTQTTSPWLAEFWCRTWVTWDRWVRNTSTDIGVRCLGLVVIGFLIDLTVSGSTKRYGRNLTEVDWILQFGFLVSFITSVNAQDARRAFTERLLYGVHSLVQEEG